MGYPVSVTARASAQGMAELSCQGWVLQGDGFKKGQKCCLAIERQWWWGRDAAMQAPRSVEEEGRRCPDTEQKISAAQEMPTVDRSRGGATELCPHSLLPALPVRRRWRSDESVKLSLG